MKGAKPVPASRTSSPNTNSATNSGSSHHFLFSFMKPHNSRKRPPRRCWAAACSNSVCFGSFMMRLGLSLPQADLELAEVAPNILGSLLRRPERWLVRGRLSGQQIPASNPEEQRNRHDYAVEHERQHELRNE